MGYNMNNDVPLGALGSGFTNVATALSPPAGKVIIAITFLDDGALHASGGLVGEVTEDTANLAFFGTNAITTGSSGAVAGNGTGNVQLPNGTIFPKGMTIYGRFTSVKMATANSTGGIIAYYGY